MKFGRLRSFFSCFHEILKGAADAGKVENRWDRRSIASLTGNKRVPTLGQALSSFVSSQPCGVRANHILNLHGRRLASESLRHVGQVVKLGLDLRCVLGAAVSPPPAPPSQDALSPRYPGFPHTPSLVLSTWNVPYLLLNFIFTFSLGRSPL